MPHDPEATRIGMEVLPRLGGAEAPAVGGELGGYRLEAELGRGGMGVVFRAVHRRLQRTVALKVLASHLAADDEFRSRFVQEARLAAALDHPNVVDVHDAGEARGHLYLAMRYVDGHDLARELADGPLEPGRAVMLLGQVASALDAAHEAGLVHRDVKPGNVLVAGDHAYLGDFGLAIRAAAHTRLTAAGRVVGTADYLAPEQVDAAPVDARTDVYALGCLLYHCLAGRPPFLRDSPIQVLFAHVQATPPSCSAARPGLPVALDAVIARAMAKDPAARFPSCSALVDAARTGLSGDQPGVDAGALPRVVVAAGATARALIRAGLQGEELAVHELAPGAPVLDAVRAAPPAVLLVEARPGSDPGPDDLRRLREDPRTAAIRVIALVDRADRAYARELVAAGAYDHLAVPFSTMQLLIKVRDAAAAAA